MIRIKAIRDCADPRAYTRGNQLYKKGMVEEFHAWKNGENLEAEASVEGSYGNEYSVSMTYDRRKEVFSDFYCECPAYHSYAGMCKHCVAVALEFMEWSENQKEEVLHQYAQKESQSGKLNGMPVDGAAKVASDAADKVISKAVGEAAEKVPGRVSGKAPEKVIQPDTDTAVTKLIFASSIQEKACYFQPEVTGNVSLTSILHHTGEGMLDIIKKRLEEEGIGYYLLTGATSKEKRSELVRSFNQNDTPVFLISLKAGGTGLNLTAASIVIHFDPWWNQAAQNQATDRTHRIGQQQVVTVYKLIMKDTLEEKILEMQEKKAGLSEEIIADGSISSVIGSKEEFMEILRGAAQ